MSIKGEYDDDNIFAKIVRGDMPCVKVFEDEATLAFMDVFPQSPGHCLVIHKVERARNMLEISDKALAAIMKTVRKITQGVNAALSPDGIFVTQFNGAPAGQTVFHTHVHIIPRYENTDINPHASGAMADMDDLMPIATKIAAAL